MSFGQNLQFLRKMRNDMTQEELAEKLGVSRQTVSRWELDAVWPEMNKLLELCTLFSCTMDQLVREDMNIADEAYSDIRIEEVAAFRYVSYAVVSTEPEDDALERVEKWAKDRGIERPEIIGWDWPTVSQEQRNVFHMRGYEAALILKDGMDFGDMEVHCQEPQKYIAVTIKQPSTAPFYVIPNAYKILMAHMQVNGIKEKWDKKIISCFEKQYERDGIDYMDVYIAVA